jgi:hypothetical protein
MNDASSSPRASLVSGILCGLCVAEAAILVFYAVAARLLAARAYPNIRNVIPEITEFAVGPLFYVGAPLAFIAGLAACYIKWAKNDGKFQVALGLYAVAGLFLIFFALWAATLPLFQLL